MSDPTGPISAGERLSPNRGEPSRNPKAKPPGRPGKQRPPRKHRSFLGFLAGFFVTGLYRFGLIAIVLAVLVGGGGFYVLNADLPSVDSLKDYRPPLESRVYASNFQLVSELADQHRIYVPYDRIPPVVAQAFISAEDRNFWIDPGIDPVAIIRAGFTDMMRMGSDRRPLGASTITQQVVKNMLLNNRINFARKIKEAILAVRISGVMSKQQILTIYLNEIYLGSNSYGVAAAAQAYFDKPLDQLTIAQAASLGALPKAPSSYDPFRHPQQALDRRNWVIGRMLADGAITADQAKTAMAEPLLPRAGGEKLTVQHAGYFADAVQQQVVDRFGADMASQGGLIIRTSLEPKLQAAAENAVRDGLQRYDQRFGGWHGLVGHVDDPTLEQNWQADLGKQPTPPGMRENWHLAVVLSVTTTSAKLGYTDNSGATGASTAHLGDIALADIRWARPLVNGTPGAPPHTMGQVLNPGDFVMVSPGSKPDSLMLEQIPNVQGALICMDPRTGRVLAMVGGWSHDLSPYNRATQAQRQPGSSVKPFVYLTAMEQNIQPDAPVLDAPFVQQMPDGTTYRPGNFEDNFQGPVPIYHALELSMNLATLNLARTVGLDNIAKNFESFGIINQMPPYYPSAIGAIDTTLWKMVTGYAALDEYGRQVTPTLIDSVTDPDGKILYQADTGPACDNCAAGNPAQPPQLTYSGQQLADPDSVFQDITMMKGVVLRGTGTPAVVGIKQPVAGKTGTTNDFNDTWFIGFTPGVLTGCWVGYDKPQSLGNDQTGGAVCGPIWNEFMKTALDGQPDTDFVVPPGDSLQQTGGVTEAFKTGQSPGAQTNDNLLAGSPAATPVAAPAQPGQPAAPAPSVDKQLGGLY
ncbi:MAG: PBP1A family penicillin-binding protein [Acidocella sp.]|nr:PBP1A family penicillin-binding protein [Acidocella sp.]